MRQIIGLALAAFVFGAVPAGAADNRYPDWPCRQLKVPELSASAIWPEPLPETAGASASEIPGLKDSAQKLATRRTPLEEAEKEISAFVAGTAEERKEKAVRLFLAMFDALNSQRFQVMNGLERAYRRQKEFVQTIQADGDKLHGLQDANADGTQIAELVTQIQWETRIFDERRKMLTYACEVPVEIDQRIFALARALQKAAGIGQG